MKIQLDGATRLFAIIGDPIAQVQSPGGLTRAMQARGCNAILVPLHVAAADLGDFVRGAALARNLDGLVLTVPHKRAAFALAGRASARSRMLAAVNVLRRGPAGWEGDMLDGLGLLRALAAAGVDPRGRRALLLGAGGAGSAIGLALIEAGVARLAIHDTDAAARDALLRRLPAAATGSDDPDGCAIVVNATPCGMRPGDALPVRADRLAPGACVADLVTAPAVTALLAQACRRGCVTVTGAAIFAAEADLLADFLLGS